MEPIIKIGVSSFTFNIACGTIPSQRPAHPLDAFGLIERAAKLGAEVLQFGDNLPLENYTGEELEKIRLLAQQRGLELEAGMREATPERLERYIDITRRIGAKILRIIIDGKIGGYEPEIPEICAVLRSVIPKLEETGVVLGIENHDRLYAREFEEIIQGVSHPQIGLTVDTTNSLSLEEPVEQVLSCMAPYCVCLHMKDYDIVRNQGGIGLKIIGACPGEGRQDIRRCIAVCREKAGRSFNIILESWMEPCGTLEASLAQEEAWAAAGIRYLREVLV